MAHGQASRTGGPVSDGCGCRMTVPRPCPCPKLPCERTGCAGAGGRGVGQSLDLGRRSPRPVGVQRDRQLVGRRLGREGHPTAGRGDALGREPVTVKPAESTARPRSSSSLQPAPFAGLSPVRRRVGATAPFRLRTGFLESAACRSRIKLAGGPGANLRYTTLASTLADSG